MIIEPNIAVEVRLEWYEVEVVRGVAQLRHDESVKNSKNPQLNRDLHADFIGAMGEMVFAKATGRYWQAEVNAKDRAGGDVGSIEVRTSERKDAPLIVRNYDIPGKIYALVIVKPIGDETNGGTAVCWYIGWCTGYYARQDHYLRKLPSGEHFCVPQLDLEEPRLLHVIHNDTRLLHGW